MVEIKSFLGTMGLTLRKLLGGENAIADYEDIQSRRMICYSCEFLTGKTKKTIRRIIRRKPRAGIRWRWKSKR